MDLWADRSSSAPLERDQIVALLWEWAEPTCFMDFNTFGITDSNLFALLTHTSSQYKESSFPLLFCIPCKRTTLPLLNKVTQRGLKKKEKKKNKTEKQSDCVSTANNKKVAGALKCTAIIKERPHTEVFLAPTVIRSQPGVNNICGAHLKSPIPQKRRESWVHAASLPLFLPFLSSATCHVCADNSRSPS